MTPGAKQDALLAAGGDKATYGRIVRQHGRQLAAILRAYGVAAGDLDDVVQEAFVAAWRALADYDQARPFKAWLFQIGLNKARDWRRRRQVRRLFYGAAPLDGAEALALETDAQSPEDAVHDLRLFARISEAVEDLPEPLKRAFLLSAVAEMTHAEAAFALGVSVKSVEGRLMRARRLLQAKLPDIRTKD